MKTVYFAHGKESGPWGIKIQRLAKVAEGYGLKVISPDYLDLSDPDERVARLMGLLASEPALEQVVLVGSSLGGYISTVAASQLPVGGLFLMAPALHYPGQPIDHRVSHCPVCVVHAWRDEVIPVEQAIRFCQQGSHALHLLDSDHRLTSALEEIEAIFSRFLETLLH